MAIDTSFIDSYLPKFPVAKYPEDEVAAAPQPSAYDRLTPTQKAWVDKQVELQKRPRSALGEIGAGVMRGAVSELPKLVGQGMKATGKPGDVLYDLGNSVVKGAAAREPKYAEDVNPDAHNAVTQAFAQGGAMLAPSLAPLVAVPLLAAAGVPAAAGLGVAGVAGAGLFGASQYQDTYEKAIKARKTPEQAHELGLQTGAIEGVGEGAATMLGGKFLGVAGRMVLPRMFGKMAADDAAVLLAKPKFLPALAKEFFATAAGETATEMGQNFGEAYVEKKAGIDNTDPYAAATSAIGPTLAMTALLAPFGGVHLKMQQSRTASLMAKVQDPNSTPEQVAAATKELAPYMLPLAGKEATTEWRMKALEDSNKNAETRKAAADALAQQQQEGQGQEILDANIAAAQKAKDYELLRAAATPTEGGPLTFAQYMKQEMQQLSLDFAGGKKKKKGADATESTLRGNYLQYLRDFDAKKQEAAAASAVPEVNTPIQGDLFPTWTPQPGAAQPTGQQGQQIPGVEFEPTAVPQGPNQPTPYPGETIPYEGMLKGQRSVAANPPARTGSGFAVDEATARLEAAKNEEQPAQGTAAMLGLLPQKKQSPIVVESPQGNQYSITKQERFKWLKGALKGVKTDTLNSLISMEPQHLADVLRQIWHDKGGGGERAPAYNQRIGELYAQLTNGGDISETRPGPDAGDRTAASLVLTPDTAQSLERAADLAADASRTPSQALTAQEKAKQSRAQGDLFGEPKPLTKEQSTRQSRLRMSNAANVAAALMKELDNGRNADEVSRQEAGQGTAQPVQQGQDASQGQDAGQGLLTSEVTNAPAAPVPAPARAAAAPKKSKAAKAAVTTVAAEANAEAAAPTSINQGVTPNAAPVSEEVPTPPPVAPEGAGAAPTVVVSHTGESRPVGYGESSTSVPAGDIKYGKAALYPRHKTQTVAEQAATRADEERFTPAPYHAEVPSSERRNVPEEKLFGFEILNYNPNAGRGTADVNVHWINEYNRALKLADQKTSAGEPTPAALNARAALKWLDEYEGADIAERIILRRIEGIFDVNDRFKEMAAERAKEIADAVNYEMEQIALERKERIARGMGLEEADTWTRAQLSAINAKLAKEERKQQAQNAWRKRELKAQDKAKAKNALAELQRQYLDIATQVIQGVADNDPTIMNLHAAIPNYTPTSELFALAKKGDGNAVLDHLATAGPSDWIRSVASLLRGLNLGTKIRFINKVARDADGKRVYARYDHGQNLVNVYIGGDNPHTMTHEIAHAASVGMVRMAKAALAKPEAQRTSQEQQLVQALGELRALMADLKKLNPPGSYAFTNEEEFLAEALSNDKLQQWMGKTMMSEARTWWQRIVDWFTSLFGGNRALDMTAFAKVLSLVPTFVTGSRFAAEQGLSFNHSAAAAMGQTDSALSSLISRWEHWTANVSLGTLGVKARMAAWMASSTFGIAQMVQRIPALKSMVHGVNDVRDADAKRGVVRQMKAQEFSTITDALKFALAKLPYTAARAMNEKLMWFAGNMSALGIDLNKNFEENKRTNPDLDPANRAFINQLHSEYKQLGESFRKPLEASFRVFRKNYIQHTAMVLRDIMRTYKGTSPQLEAMEGLLDILNPALSEGTNPRPDYYHDAYSANLDKVIRRVMSEARGLSTGKDHLSADIRDVEKFYLAAVSNPYMHLGRSGDHFLEFNAANVPGGWESIRAALAPFGKGVGARNEKGHVFLRFEDPGKRDAAQRAITALGAVVQGGSLRSGSLFDSDSLTNSQGVLRLARNLIQKVETDYPGPKNAEMRAAIRELILRMAYDMLPDSSPQQALRERKNGGIAGYDLDFMRNFAKRSEGMASMMANSYSMPMYDKAFALLKDETGKLESAGNGHEADMAKEVLSEMSKRFVNSITPVDSPLIDSFKAYGFNYFLAFSPAFWLTNLAQPWHLTLPVLGGKFGFVKAAKEMGRSTAKAAKLMQAAVKAGWNSGNDAGGKYGALLGVLDLKLPVDQVGLTDEEQEYVKRLILSGELDTTQGHELARYASGDSPTTTAITKTLSMGSHYTEVLNRLTAGLAGYNLARTAEKPMSIEAATLYATNEVVHTQFNYSDHNIARALGRHGVLGKVTPLVSSFSHYSFQTIEFLIHLTLDSIAPLPTGGTQQEMDAAMEARAAARKSLLGVLGTTGVLAGSLGMPAMSVLTAVIDRVLGSDDDPLDSKAAYRKWLADTFGTEVGEAIARGVPRALMGFDTSSRMGMQDIIPGSRFMSDRRAFKDKMEAGAFNLLGPAVSAATSTAVGAGKIMDGQVMDGLIDFLPLALKGPAKAVKQQDEGFTTTTGNKLPLEVTPWGTAAQAIGFTPSARAEQSEVNFAFRQRDALLKQRKNTLANAAYKAIEQGEDATDALQEVMRFNEQNPQYRIDIGSGLRLRAKQRATAEITDIPTLPRYLPMLDRYSYANVK